MEILSLKNNEKMYACMNALDERKLDTITRLSQSSPRLFAIIQMHWNVINQDLERKKNCIREVLSTVNPVLNYHFVGTIFKQDHFIKVHWMKYADKITITYTLRCGMQEFMRRSFTLE